MSANGHGSPSELSDLIALVWARVAQQVNRLLDAHERFGFVHFKANLNPTLEDVIQMFVFIDFTLTKMLDSGLLEPDEVRRALNSKQCILRMRQLSAALDENDDAEYCRIINDLNLQAQF